MTVPPTPEDWSAEEVAATVAAYFEMLFLEVEGEPYNKRERNRRLGATLNNRSAGAIEFKHANISAVLLLLGYPYIDGYKPRSNFQQLLRDEVELRVAADAQLAIRLEQVVSAPAVVPAIERPFAELVVEAPQRAHDFVYDRRLATGVTRRGVDYLAMEARNAFLGAAGEEFAMEAEYRRLRDAGQRTLAERIEHVSRTRGDGLGYDILSFETDGRPRLIEVKTTRFGQMTPFHASRNEVMVSESEAAQFHLYRLFSFRDDPRLFVLPGSLRESVRLDAVQYLASIL
jgi:hypothetical protein